MLRWRELYPYNAVHAVRVDAPLDVARLASTINAVLEARGLAGLALDPARSRFEYSGGAPRIALDVLPGGADPGRVLDARDRARPQHAVRSVRPARSVPVLRRRRRPGCTTSASPTITSSRAATRSPICCAEIVLRDAATTQRPPATPSLYPPNLPPRVRASRAVAARGLRRGAGSHREPAALAAASLPVRRRPPKRVRLRADRRRGRRGDASARRPPGA